MIKQLDSRLCKHTLSANEPAYPGANREHTDNLNFSPQACFGSDADTMGGQLSKMMGKIFGNKEMRLLMLGLDAAGKTSTPRNLSWSPITF